MPHEKLENLVKIRQLKAEEASRVEIAGLLRSGTARLEDSKNTSLNRESRFDLAYNAAHALSPAALRQPDTDPGIAISYFSVPSTL